MLRIYRLGAFEVRPVERELRSEGALVPIGSRAFDVLLALIERRERVVPKAELLELAWPGLVVEENNLQAQVSALRKALGHAAVATIPGVGYRLCIEVDDAEAPAASSAGGGSGNLPTALESLIGRENEARELQDLLRTHRLVNLVGPGGIGKTRLALHVASQAWTDFADGAWWIDLAAVRSGERVAAAIANALGLDLRGAASLDTIAATLGPQRRLLLLDNCEQVLAEVADMATGLVSRCPRLHLLATSQVPLHVTGEQLYRVRPLDVPSLDEGLDSACRSSAMRLLLRRARAVDPAFRMAPEELASAIGICAALEGIPLALEMAAARLPVLGFASLYDRLKERPLGLVNASHHAPDRQRSLAATLAWSYGLLTPGEQRVLRRLAGFAGAFRLDAARVMASGGAGDEWESVEALATLAEKSLIQVVQLEPPRYRLLETTRAFLVAAGSEDDPADLAQWHGAAMTAIAREARATRNTLSQAAWVERYVPDYEDLQMAFDHAFERSDTVTLAWTGALLSDLDTDRDIEWPLQRRKAMSRALLDQAGPCERLLLLASLTSFYKVPVPGMGRLETAQARLAAARAVGDTIEIYTALGRLAHSAAGMGEWNVVQAALEEASAFDPQSLSPRARMLFAFQALRSAEYGIDPVAARSRAHDFLRAARDYSRHGELVARYYVAKTYLMEELWEEAASRLAEAEDALGCAGLRRHLVDCTTQLACALLHLDQDERARRCLCRRHADALATVAPWAYLTQVAWLAARGGHLETAGLLLGQADNTREPHPEPIQAGMRSARRVESLLEGAVYPEAAAVLRRQGAGLGPAAVMRLVRAELGAAVLEAA